MIKNSKMSKISNKVLSTTVLKVEDNVFGFWVFGLEVEVGHWPLSTAVRWQGKIFWKGQDRKSFLL